MSIPIVIGVTGHRDLRPEDLPQLRSHVHSILKTYKDQCPDSPLILLDSLASGGDTLCAEEALSLGYRLVCPLPLPPDEYRKDFDETEIKTFDRLLASAESVFVSPAIEPERDSRDFWYRQAGLYVACHCHVLLALWDNAAAKPDGCGTAEIAAYKQMGCPDNKEPLNADPGAVMQVVTPRMKNAVNPEIAARLWEKEPGQLEEILRETNDFNRDAAAFTPEYTPDPLLPDACMEHPGLKRLSELYREADGLSVACQKRYLRTMRGFAIAGVLLVLFFLLYDTGESNLFLFGYGLLLGLYFLVFLFVQKRNAHGKHLNYRLLAETARIQTYLTAAGAKANTGSLLTWTQKRESAWIKAAMDAMTAEACETCAIDEDTIKRCWIDKQRAYHLKTEKRDGQKHRINERTTRVMLYISVFLAFAILLLELFGGPLMETTLISALPAFWLPHAGQALTLRSLFKLLLGIVSAVTVFLAEYYGKLSFGRKTEDHVKMARLYSGASERFESHPEERKALFLALAREEIIENGNWLSYCKENPPSFNV